MADFATQAHGMTATYLSLRPSGQRCSARARCKHGRARGQLKEPALPAARLSSLHAEGSFAKEGEWLEYVELCRPRDAISSGASRAG